MAGQATYCAAKAGMDNLSRAVALDQASCSDNGAKIVSLAPGVVDTDMQIQLRSSERQRFSRSQTFVKLKESGQPDLERRRAARAVAYLGRADSGAIRWPTFAIPDCAPRRGGPLGLRHNR